MKLKTKIQLSFCVTIVAFLLVMGNVLIFESEKASNKIIQNSMNTSATLASNHISKQLEDYMNIVTLVGKDDVVSSTKSAEKKAE